MMDSKTYLDKILSTRLTKLTKTYLKQKGKCNKIILSSGTIMYEYDCLEIIATGLELIAKIKQIRGLDI